MLKPYKPNTQSLTWKFILKTQESISQITKVEPTKDKERELWVELKRLFEIDENDTLWKLLKGHDIFMVVENDYFIEEALDDFDVDTDDLIGRNLMINKMNIKFRGGLLGIKASQVNTAD
ncbi:hypothetical protein Tco_0620439 [Tanacetum coccineum]